MKKLYDLCVIVGKYTQNGQEKPRFSNIGSIWKKDDGKIFGTLKAYFNPAAITRQEGSDSIFFSLMEPKDNNNSNSKQNNSSRSNNSNNNSQQWDGDINSDFDDSNDKRDIPF